MQIEVINQAAQNIADAANFLNAEMAKSNEKMAKYEAELSPAKFGVKAKKLFLKAEQGIADVAEKIRVNSATIVSNAKQFTDDTAKGIALAGVFPGVGEIETPDNIFSNLAVLATGAGVLGTKIAQIAGGINKYPKSEKIVDAYQKMLFSGESLVKLSSYIDATIAEIKSPDLDDSDDE